MLEHLQRIRHRSEKQNGRSRVETKLAPFDLCDVIGIGILVSVAALAAIASSDALSGLVVTAYLTLAGGPR